MSSKPLILTPRAARWLHDLVHDPRLAVSLADARAATEAVDALDAHVKKLGPAPPPAPAAPPPGARAGVDGAGQ